VKKQYHKTCPHGIRVNRCVPCGGTKEPSPKKCLHNQQHAQCWICRPQGRYVKYRCSASDKGFEFTLTVECLLALVQQPCRYCGKTPAHGIDRLDNTIGYHQANCAACCTQCNRMKSDLSVSKFLKHVQNISNFQQEIIQCLLP